METSLDKKIIESRLAEIDRLIKESNFIGLFDSTQAIRLKTLATSKGIESTMLVKDILIEGKKALVNQFEELAHKGGVQELKAKQPEYFAKLWRAKFNKNPSL